ncbi:MULTISPECIES: hypothetical protein [unclassified Novosphingobium]|uniref:hypothetical protein n=1 Tax=unclassified Novosphingobium TaxID=2644732 RepID=UPI00144854C6|nr:MULTISPECIES: hypothetical protein [unclassified Novosphingobium]NKJ45062.1 hypothetical protein [Novosphingobium sp. SG720]NMN07633.1 hypothetical protein [Novosphingobium sp. SG919]NMN89943.1 hypothetical protein [Novosphingobium sp. SG916]
MNREPSKNVPAVTEVNGFDADTAIRALSLNGRLYRRESSICPALSTKGSASL